MNVVWFVDEVLEKVGERERGCFVPIRVLWELFKGVCKAGEKKSCSQRKFVRRLKELGFKIGPRICVVEGVCKNVWCCLRVRVKEGYKEEYEKVMSVLKIERRVRGTKKKSESESVGRSESAGRKRREPGENNVKWFVDRVLERKRDDFIPFIPLEVLWEFFADDCDALHKRPCSQEGFGRRLGELGFKVGPQLVRVAGKWEKVICCFDVTIDEVYLDDLEDWLIDFGYEREVEWVRKRKEWLGNEERKKEG